MSMKLVHVIPIAKGIGKERLTYFSSRMIEPGCIVSVPLRNRTVPALVFETKDIMEERGSLRQSPYALKKIVSGSERKLFLPEFMTAMRETADFFGGTLGSVIFQAVPNVFFEQPFSLSDTFRSKVHEGTASRHETRVCAQDEESRIREYRSLVREMFAKKTSVFILVPRINDVEYLHERVSKGIEQYVYAFHSAVPKKELRKRMGACMNDKHAVLIIATGPFLSLPRGDIGTIIVERENAREFKMQSRPYLDFRNVAAFYAKARSAELIYGDLPLSIETLFYYYKKDYGALLPFTSHIPPRVTEHIIDMRAAKGREFRTISDDFMRGIEKAIRGGGNTFVFTVRRGLAPMTVCEDCGAVVTCTECGAPVVLHEGDDGNVFMCHACGKTRSAREKCATCTGWKLTMLGVGTTRIKHELVRKFGAKNVFTIDSDTTKTYEDAYLVADEFYNTPGSILCGTGLALSFVRKPILVTGIASVDSLLSLPDPTMYEHIFSLVTRVRELAQNEFYLETRQPELPFITDAVSGNIRNFYEREIANRERFTYPPFAVLIKLTVVGTEAKAGEEMKRVALYLSNYPFFIYPAFTPLSKGRYALHGLIKIKSDMWPDKKLLGLLRTLPPSVSVNVRPGSIL